MGRLFKYLFNVSLFSLVIYSILYLNTNDFVGAVLAAGFSALVAMLTVLAVKGNSATEVAAAALAVMTASLIMVAPSAEAALPTKEVAVEMVIFVAVIIAIISIFMAIASVDDLRIKKWKIILSIIIQISVIDAFFYGLYLLKI